MRERLLNIIPIFILICIVATLFGCSIHINVNTDTENNNKNITETNSEFPFEIKSNSPMCEAEIKQELNNIIGWAQDEDWFYYLIWILCECDFETEWVDRAVQQRKATEQAINYWEAVDQEWIPWQVNEEWTAQVIPTFEVTAESHENFKNFINRFNSNVKPWDVWNVEHFYWIKEWVVACIAFAETSMWTRGYWLCNNVGNVGNNDRGNRHCYATVQWGLEAIWQTLNNWNLWAKQTIGCLSRAGHCTEVNDNGMIRASSPSSRENNVVNCLEAIYQQEIDPSTFNFRV